MVVISRPRGWMRISLRGLFYWKESPEGGQRYKQKQNEPFQVAMKEREATMKHWSASLHRGEDSIDQEKQKSALLVCRLFIVLEDFTEYQLLGVLVDRVLKLGSKDEIQITAGTFRLKRTRAIKIPLGQLFCTLGLTVQCLGLTVQFFSSLINPDIDSLGSVTLRQGHVHLLDVFVQVGTC
uniref:Uncharacterized protein n=1 Tax=Molossus molossus TaxID=27622 RepID=A0A7J8HG91_MOLMO|nr:hypothetical protein HJG59_002797 [Molossus molossus]